MTRSCIHAIKLDKADDSANDFVVPACEYELAVIVTFAVHASGHQGIDHGTQPGHEHAYSCPTPKAQPAIDKQSPAKSVELDLAGEEKEGVGVEGWLVSA